MKDRAFRIMNQAIDAMLPDVAVVRALKGHSFKGNVYVVAVGKAAWRMANAALFVLGESVADGVVVTKYGHTQGPLGPLKCIEAGHPIPDENSLAGADAALRIAQSAKAGDTVIFLVSGGASALFEKPAVSLESTVRITQQLLAAGADISQINAVRKHLSLVKGGRFAQACAPAQVFQVVLSDVVGNRLDVIASGPAAADLSTSQEALGVCKQFGVLLSPEEEAALRVETPKAADNVQTEIAGGVELLCAAVEQACWGEGFEPIVLTTTLAGEARDAGADIAWLANRLTEVDHMPTALIMGGETVVHVKGDGIGGRSQELALAAAHDIAGSERISVMAFGSDGTDGPTDAAGGFVDGNTWQAIAESGMDPQMALDNNDAYHALQRAGALVITGPTGTNVNDVVVAFVR